MWLSWIFVFPKNSSRVEYTSWTHRQSYNYWSIQKCHYYCLKLDTGYSTVLYSVGSCARTQRSWTINNWFYPVSAPALSFHQVCTCFCLISREPIVAATVLSTLARAPESSPDWSWEHYCQEEEEEEGVALTGRTGPPSSVGRAPGPPAGDVIDDRRRQTIDDDRQLRSLLVSNNNNN